MKFHLAFFAMVFSLQISFAQKDSIKINGVNFLTIRTVRENVTGNKRFIIAVVQA